MRVCGQQFETPVPWQQFIHDIVAAQLTAGVPRWAHIDVSSTIGPDSHVLVQLSHRCLYRACGADQGGEGVSRSSRVCERGCEENGSAQTTYHQANS